MAKLPKTIRVGYATVSVEKLPAETADAAGHFGQYTHFTQKIRLRTDSTPVKTANTLLHELFHAMWTIADLPPEHEEHQVVLLANALTQVWRDNPELVAFIEETLRAEQ